MYDFAHSTELLAKSQAASLQALELDDSLSAAHYTLAMNRLASSWDWSGAEVEARRAIEVNPSNASAHWWYSDLLIFQGRMAEAEAEIQRAQELNPSRLKYTSVRPRVSIMSAATTNSSNDAKDGWKEIRASNGIVITA